MKEYKAKTNRLGRRLKPRRIEGSPMQQREEATNRMIGRRVRELRILLGMSMMQMGEATGVSYQAFQKYEKGKNAIDAARLLRIAEILDEPIGYFLEAPAALAPHDSPNTRILRLASKLQRIERQSPKKFKSLCRLITKLAKNEE